MSYSDGQGTQVVVDGDAADANPAVREIKTSFALAVAPNRPWSASGTIEASSQPDGYATTRLTEVLLEKEPGGEPIVGATLRVEHCFDNETTTPVSYEAQVDGEFDSSAVPPIIHEASLNYHAQVNDETIGVSADSNLGGLAPVPFMHLLGPHEVQLPPARSHTHTLIFYLDADTDQIRLPNSALIRPASGGLPAIVPGSILLVAALILAAGLRARREARQR